MLAASRTTGAEPPPGDAVEEPLESWKEIASYLGRDVRTVRRWETDEDLPVHRHLHVSRPTIYAYRSELDAWRTSRKAEPQPERNRQAHRLPRWSWAAILATAAVVTALIWSQRAPAFTLGERDSVLISHFENRTGDAIFDRTVEAALERELSNSRFVNVAPRERINDTLRLMQRPLDSRIDRNLGREIALRDGGVRALVSGSIEKTGSTYSVEASIVEPLSGATIKAFSETAASRDGVIAAVSRISAEVRETLGEELRTIRESSRRLERVTTPSLEALQLYSQATGLISEFRWAEAGDLLQRALSHDRDFAAAHVHLAHSLSNQGRHEQARAHYRRAFELADHTSERERLFILGSHAQAEGSTERAVEYYRTLVQFHPDDLWGTKNLIAGYARLGRQREAVEYRIQQAELRPNDLESLLMAAMAVAVWGGDQARAASLHERAQRLATSGLVTPQDWQTGWLELFPIYVEWLKGDLQGAMAEAERLERDAATREPRVGAIIRTQLALFQIALGRNTAGERLLDPSSRNPYVRDNLALLALAAGDAKRARDFMTPPLQSHTTAILLATLGDTADAGRLLSAQGIATRHIAPHLPATCPLAARSHVAAAKGRTGEAIPLLEDAFDRLRPWPSAFFFITAETLARAHAREGNVRRALEVLDAASQERSHAVFFGIAPLFWMRTELQRAEILRASDRPDDAARIEATLRHHLAHSDAGHPIRVALREGEALKGYEQ